MSFDNAMRFSRFECEAQVSILSNRRTRLREVLQLSRVIRRMNSIMKKSFPVFPLMYCLFPVLSLYESNIEELELQYILAPVVAVLMGMTICWVASGLIIHDAAKSGLLVSFSLFWFFSYGHIETFLQQAAKHSALLANPFVMYTMWILVFEVGIWLVLRYGNRLTADYTMLTIMAIALIALPVFKIVSGQFERLRGETRLPIVDTHSMSAAKVELPDIYYIVLDGYARADTLKGIYKMDNTPFLSYLRTNGFQIADRATSNYCQTMLSLSSSLNMDYVDSLLNHKLRPDSQDRYPLSLLIRNNRAFDIARKMGYTTVAFGNDYELSNAKGADIFIKSKKSMSSFNSLLLSLTPVEVLTKPDSSISGYENHRAGVLSILKRLPSIVQGKKPTFVFAHILVPHPPFVFGRDGKPCYASRRYGLNDGSHFRAIGGTTAEYRIGYRDQVMFVNGRIEQVITQILAKAKRPTVIILQGDHGPSCTLDFEKPKVTGIKERSRILCAVRVPRETKIVIPSDITPVNVLRTVFGYYFDRSLRPLENRTYYSTWSRPYDFTDVTSVAKGVGISVNWANIFSTSSP